MSPFIPSLPPRLVQLGFDYVLAVEAGNDVQAAQLASEVQQLPGLLPAIAELIVFPVTALTDDTDPCADSFALDEVGVIYLMAIHGWATDAPAAAAPESPVPSRTSPARSSPSNPRTSPALCRRCATSIWNGLALRTPWRVRTGSQ
ncbi:hypothetical protein [Streptomyces sp. NEAU-S7GS2]|uniref:hypothetical protein n=1 Tax=Streptomyces sp. NEAU-S7GS2 TaxID=2202000 RepID=UPI000D6F7A7B|nr:hypothetical protein [Streptomyces sp. NEAU-S7GS2]AWN24873.1 hypothetical protein DKG71_00600 [Streptomyces sp. NEAU-S7GS2]